MGNALARADVTFASPSGSDSKRAPAEQLYAPTEEASHQCSLVFPGPRMKLTTFVQMPGRKYELKGVFVVQIEHLPDGVCFVSHRALPVHGYGIGQAEALASFCESFDMQWRDLVEEEEANLTAGGIARRNALKAVVSRVVEQGSGG